MAETKKSITKLFIVAAISLGAVAALVVSAEQNMLLAINTPAASQNNLTGYQSVNYFPTGSLVLDNGAIYFIYGTTKIPFTNYAAFKGLGYSLKNVVTGDLSHYSLVPGYQISTANMAHPWGSWLLVGNTVYYSSSQGMIGVTSPDIFFANGGSWNYLVKANHFDIAILNSNPKLPALTASDPRIFGQSANPDNTATTTNATSGAISVIPGFMPVSISTTTIVTMPSSQLAQCGSDMDCFIKDAQTCTASEVTFNLNITKSSLTQTMQSDLQIQGQQSGKCQFYQKILAAGQSFSQDLKTQLQKSGMTLDQVAQTEQYANSQVEKTIGDVTLCQYNNTDLVAVLQAWQQGNFTSNISGGNCQINLQKN